MKKTFLLLMVIFSVMFFKNNSAQDKGFGLGIIIGEPTGISGKLWLGGNNALDFGVGWSFVGGKDKGNMFSVHADYLFHFPDAIKASAKFPLYAGIGGRIKAHHDNETSIGVRGVFGIAWWPEGVPLDVFLEIAPIFTLVQKTGFDIGGGLGIRYFF